MSTVPRRFWNIDVSKIIAPKKFKSIKKCITKIKTDVLINMDRQMFRYYMQGIENYFCLVYLLNTSS